MMLKDTNPPLLQTQICHMTTPGCCSMFLWFCGIGVAPGTGQGPDQLLGLDEEGPRWLKYISGEIVCFTMACRGKTFRG